MLSKEPVMSAVLGMNAAAVGLLVAFGVHLTDVQIMAITQFVEASLGLGLLVRSKVTPTVKALPVPVTPANPAP